MRPSHLSLEGLEELPRYEVRHLGPAYNTRSSNNNLYRNFNNNENYKKVLNMYKLPQTFYLINNQGQNTQFNISPEILHHINSLPNESRIFAIFNSAEQIGGGKKKRGIIKKKFVKNKQQKKRGGMPRPAPLTNLQLGNDNHSHDNYQPSVPLLQNVPMHARSFNPSLISPTSPGPAYTSRDTRVEKHLDGLVNMLEYSNNLVYDLNTDKGLSEEQKYHMQQYMNSQNFTIVSNWCKQNKIPQKFNLYNSHKEMNMSFEFKNPADTSEIMRAAQRNPNTLMYLLFGSLLLIRGGSYNNKNKNTKKNNIIKKKKIEKKKVEKKKVEKKKIEKKKVEKKKIEKKKVEKKKVKKKKVEKKKVKTNK